MGQGLSNALSAEGVIAICVDRIDQCNTTDGTDEIFINNAYIREAPEVDAVRYIRG